MTDDVPFHPLADIFPLIEGVAFRDLVEDIRLHGLRAPIILHEGRILDGRNRYLACRAAQVAARFKSYDGKDPLAFVVSANLHRRHLDVSQRALIAAELCGERVGRGARRKDGRRGNGGRLLRPLKHPHRAHRYSAEPSPGDRRVTPLEAGELLNVNQTSVRDAISIRDLAVPELIQAVRAGAVSVQPAKEIAQLPPDQQMRILKSGDARAVRVVGQKTRRERLQERRLSRAASAATPQAIFDHVKIGDGRAMGNVQIAEAAGLAESLFIVAEVLLAISRHVANVGSMRVRDAISEKTLAEMIEHARTGRRSRGVA